MFCITTFIEFLENYNDTNLKMIIGSSNYDDPNNNIFDKTRFDNIFDIAVSNTYKIEQNKSLKLLYMNFNEYILLRYAKFSKIDTYIYFKLEKMEKIVIDWSVIKFINIKFLILLSIFYLSKNGKMYFECCTFSEKQKMSPNIFFIENNEIRINNIGTHYFTSSVFYNNTITLSCDRIIYNNYKYLRSVYNKYFPNSFKIKYINDNNYPNNPMNFNKNVYKYFVIKKIKNLKIQYENFKNLNRFLYFG